MLSSTLSLLCCPACGADLRGTDTQLDCTRCENTYPVLAGVPILVPDVRGYLTEHVKGISRYVTDEEIPKTHRAAFVKAKKQIEPEHIEEDLEAERVTALYVMNQYLRAADVHTPSPAIAAVVKEHWDNGPFARIRNYFESAGTAKGKRSLIELGCGVGGLFPALRDSLKSYLGLDSSFASVVLARHLALGAPLPRRNGGSLLVPDDLLLGSVSREVKITPTPSARNVPADFVVCDLSQPPVKPGIWDVSAALNVIDMIPEPAALPALQAKLLTENGIAIQASPYVWHPEVAAALREEFKDSVKDSAEAVESLYRRAGFKIAQTHNHVPWLFFKNIRQLELYSLHLFFASK